MIMLLYIFKALVLFFWDYCIALYPNILSVSQHFIIFLSVSQRFIIFLSVNQRFIIFLSVNQRFIIFLSVSQRFIIFLSVNQRFYSIFLSASKLLFFILDASQSLFFIRPNMKQCPNFCFKTISCFFIIFWIIFNMFQMLFLIMYKTYRFWPLVWPDDDGADTIKGS